MGLTLSRYQGEACVIDGRPFGMGLIYVTFVEQRGNKVRLDFDADRNIEIHRFEVFTAIERQRNQGASDA